MSARFMNGTWTKSVFQDILYAQCWEDPEIDRKAFRITPDDVVFSITSGGCNVLTFLIDNPREVIALDLNPCQNYVLDLKMAAFQNLTYDEMMEFVGVRPSSRREILYHRLRPQLRVDSRAYWDEQHDKIQMGVIHSGRYEAYLRLLRRCLYRLKGRQLITGFFRASSRSDRIRLYRKEWDTTSWRLFTRLLLSRTIMTLLFDQAFFAQVEESFSFGKHFRALVEQALTGPSPRHNPYLSYILLGYYRSHGALPVYLQRQNFELIRDRLNRIRMVSGDCNDYLESCPSRTIAKFSFSNVFEWMESGAFEQVLRETVRVARNDAVITYRNLLVPRSRPEAMATLIKPDRSLAEALHRIDRSFIYKAYIVERIAKGDERCRTTSRRQAVAA